MGKGTHIMIYTFHTMLYDEDIWIGWIGSINISYGMSSFNLSFYIIAVSCIMV